MSTPLTSAEKLQHILELDEELLVGGVVVSEFSAFLVRDVDVAYCAGAYLAAMVLSQAAIESHLRYEYADSMPSKPRGFRDLIEASPLEPDLRAELHHLRRVRNAWIHVSDPAEDAELLSNQNRWEDELAIEARNAIRLLRRVLYLEQTV